MIKAYRFGLVVDEEGETNYETAESNLNSTSEDDDDIDFNDMSFFDIQLKNNYEDAENSSDSRLSCFLHSLQLCVRDGLKNSTYIPRLFKKCQAFSKASHKPSKIADLLEDLNKPLSRLNITRWNSEYILIKSILSVGKDDLALIASMMNHPIRFSNHDLIVFQEFIDILEPFSEISLQCQAEEAVAASLVVPSIVHLLVHLRDVKSNIKVCHNLIQQIEESLQKRFSGIMARLNLVDVVDNEKYGDPIYFIAAVLDPSFRFYWVRDLRLSGQAEKRLKHNIVGLIIGEINKDMQQSQLKSNQVNGVATTNDDTVPKVKRRKLFDYGINTNNATEGTTLDPTVELDVYLNDP